MSPRPFVRSRARTLALTALEDRTVPSTTWSQRGGDSGHTSYVDVAFDPSGMTPSWNRPLTFEQSGTGSWDERAVAIDDRHVYRTDLEGYAPSGTYHVFAFNKDTGAEVWHRTFAAGAFEGVSEPSVANGIVYVNRAGHSGISGGSDADLPRIYGLNALTGSTVQERRYAAQWGSNDRPAIDGTQLVSEDGYYGGISSFNTASSLSRQWHNPGWQLLKPFAAFDDQYVYAFNNVVFQRSNGARLADISHPTLQTESAPMVSQTGKVLFDVTGTVNGASAYGVAAYDGDTHALLWTANTPSMVRAKAVGNGVVAVSSGTRLSLFNEADGSLLRTWDAPAGYNLTGEIVLTRTHAFVQTAGSWVATIHAIDLATGQEAWRYENRPVDFSGATMEMAMGGGQLVLSSYKFVRAFATGAAPVNQPPVATDDTGSTNEDTPVAIPVLANDSDPDGDALTVTAVSQPANGSVAINANGTITYTPAAGYHGPDSFTYTIVDGRGGTDTATVTVSVIPVNDSPVAQDDAYATNEDMPLTISPAGVLANDSDPDGDPLMAVLVDAPTKGTLTLNADGSFNYVPHANSNGTDTFTYVARDGLADSAPATVTLTIRPVNDAPSFTGGADQTAPEDAGPQSVSPWATNISAGPPDEAGQSLQFLVFTDNAALFSVLPAIGPDGTLTYTPAPNAFGSATVTVALQDNGGTEHGGIDTSESQTFTIAVTPRPDVTDTTINNGDVQRSRVTEIAVTFDMAVDPALLVGAFTLTRSSDGLQVGSIHVTTTVQDGRTTARLTFSGPGTQAGSLADGLWVLKVSGAFLSADYTLDLHRLFGDADGDRDVDQADEVSFNSAFGKKSNQVGYLSYFDFDQDVNQQGLRDIDNKDRAQFRQRLGSSI